MLSDTADFITLTTGTKPITDCISVVRQKLFFFGGEGYVGISESSYSNVFTPACLLGHDTLFYFVLQSFRFQSYDCGQLKKDRGKGGGGNGNQMCNIACSFYYAALSVWLSTSSLTN